jgi:hypothetical protein
VGDLLVVQAMTTGTIVSAGPGVMTGTGGGNLTFTKIFESNNPGNTKAFYLFVATSLVTSTASAQFTFSCVGDPATGFVFRVWTVTGMSKTGTAAIKQRKEIYDGTPATAPTITFDAACDTNNPTMALLGNNTLPPGLTPPSGWTEQADTSYSSPGTGTEQIYRNNGFSGSTITWGSNSGTLWEISAVELDTSAAAPSSNFLMFFP